MEVSSPEVEDAFNALQERAWASLERDEDELALDLFWQAYHVLPEPRDRWDNSLIAIAPLITTLRDFDRPEEALAVLHRLAGGDILRDRVWVIALHATVLWDLGRNDDALDLARQAKSYDPAFSQHVFLGYSELVLA